MANEKEVTQLEELITIAKNLNKAFAGGPDTSYKNGLSAMGFVIAVCEPLIADIKGRKAANEQARHGTWAMEGNQSVAGSSGFNLERERARLKAEGKVI